MSIRCNIAGYGVLPGALLVILLFSGLSSMEAQNERKVIRHGVKSYEKGEYGEAEVQFRKAGDLNRESFEAGFNTGAALYGQEKYDETVKQYESMVDMAGDPGARAQVWHNIGNSLLEAQQYAPGIEAYKNSLRLNPGDQDTKYNLAYAKQKLQEQQQQQQQQQDQNDQQQDQDKQDQQQDQDKQDQNEQQQQDQDKQDQNEQQQQQQEQDQQDQNEQQQQQPLQISKEDAERMLSAIQQQEKDVKEKVDKKKAAAAKVKTEKDW